MVDDTARIVRIIGRYQGEDERDDALELMSMSMRLFAVKPFRVRRGHRACR